MLAPAEAKHKNERGRAEITIFSADDRRIVVEYFRTRGSGLPPGLAKRGGNLPPGLEKQLRRNGRLPPGLEKRLEPFPVELERRLPVLPSGLHRGVIGGRAVIYDPGRSIVLDAFVVF